MSGLPSNAGDERFEPDARFLLANERTLLAWIRTGVALQAGGVAILQFFPDLDGRAVIGIGLLIIGALAGLIGYRRYRAADRAIRGGALPPAGHGPEVITFAVILLSVVLAGIYLITDVT